ncbi:hypothetical protein TWF106_008114 [Orbilia oligospora]|uniref:Uncharacterized protein n=1 Tax=Orbilia oligospora TaxID=2813651 RepID=A0A6G1LYM8_ORBOL|nr:hypothetical protein TWF788_008804 [Orbilia oligospora]KAF3214889.1 hypothetical protein TWF679_004667 [Orbilia oligospora]KAF3217065.1 hypothetical protein TWF106_008114 [Orbilia oligospora]KAF3239079.1 hypothetical protein TWF192_010157 [Orbilia oligospora]
MNARTASPSQSIWRDLDENTFRTHLISLEERTNAVPVDPQLFLLPTDTDNSRKFSIDDEQKLADAFAFLVAVEQGAQSVAAVCLEENLEEQSLVVCFAAIDTIDEYLQESLGKICGTLAVYAQSGHGLNGDELFELIIRLHHRRILGRLRSSKWEKPTYLSRTHKKPLWEDFRNLLHRVQFLYTKKEKSQRKVVETEIEYLAKLYECFETVTAQSDDEVSSIESLVKASYGLCTSNSIKDYAHRLETVGPTPQLRSAVKTLRQIEKIAAYYRVTQTLLRASQRYPYYFQHLKLKYLPPYAGIPTDIGYEEWAKTCHVHAEVQLAVYYDLRQKGMPVRSLPPRVIGTSKYLCYLCYLFLKSHGRYPPANTHGRLYDQWTIPDLFDMEDGIRRKYTEIVRLMDQEVVEKATEKPQWRSEPMTSRENLLDAMEDDKSIALWRRATKPNSSTSLEF